MLIPKVTGSSLFRTLAQILLGICGIISGKAKEIRYEETGAGGNDGSARRMRFF